MMAEASAQGGYKGTAGITGADTGGPRVASSTGGVVVHRSMSASSHPVACEPSKGVWAVRHVKDGMT